MPTILMPALSPTMEEGKLSKWYSEICLMNQAFIKEDKKTVRQYLDGVEKGLTVTVFRRVQLG